MTSVFWLSTEHVHVAATGSLADARYQDAPDDKLPDGLKRSARKINRVQGKVLASMSTRSIPRMTTPICPRTDWKQDLAIDAGPGLRRSREMATIGKLENIPSVLFNLWRQ
jgi:hypothetical protein